MSKLRPIPWTRLGFTPHALRDWLWRRTSLTALSRFDRACRWKDPSITSWAVPSNPQAVRADGTENASQPIHHECGDTAGHPRAAANEQSAPAMHTQLTMANGLTARFTPPSLR